jgi:hypothetical protein
MKKDIQTHRAFPSQPSENTFQEVPNEQGSESNAKVTGLGEGDVHCEILRLEGPPVNFRMRIES